MLTAGEQIAHAAKPFGKERKQRGDLFKCPGIAYAFAIRGRREKIFTRGQIRENLPTFRSQADAELRDPVGRHVANFPTTETDRTRPRLDQPHDRAHRRGFSHAVAAHQGHHFAARDGEREPEQHLAQAVARLDAADLEQRANLCAVRHGLLACLRRDRHA